VGETRPYLEGKSGEDGEFGVKSWPKGEWPPLSGTSNGICILAEFAAQALLDANVDGIALRPIRRVFGWGNTQPAKLKVPNLYALCPQGRLLLDESYFRETAYSKKDILRMVPMAQQPQSQDLCLTENHPGVGLICTMKVLLIAREEKWKHLEFNPIDNVDNDVDFAVDYLGKQWPPKWYPDGFEPHPNNLSDDLPPDPLKASKKKN
jgi:hypothetical protein